MKQKILAVTIIFSFLFQIILLVPLVHAQEELRLYHEVSNLMAAGEYHKSRLVVEFKQTYDDEQFLARNNASRLVERENLVIIQKNEEKKFSNNELRDMLSYYLSLDEVEFAEPLYLYRPSWVSVEDGVMPSEYNATRHQTHIAAGFHRLMEELNCDTMTPDAACGGLSTLTVAVLDSGNSFENFTWSGGQNNFGTEYGTPSEFDVDDVFLNSGESYNQSDSDGNGYVDDLHGVDIETWYDCNDPSYGYFSTVSGTTPCLGEDETKIGRPYDDNGHGMFIASQLSSDIENGQDMIGLVYNTPVMGVDIFYYQDTNDLGSSVDFDEFFADSFTISTGIEYAVDNGADVINMSFGGSAPSTLVQNSVDYAEQNNVVLVAASGNQSSNPNTRPVNYPAAYATVLSVGAANADGTDIASYSTFGTAENENALFVDLVAPAGFSVYAESLTCFHNANCDTNYSGADYTDFSIGSAGGTSFAAPQVAAAAIYIKAFNPSYSAQEIRSVLRQSTIDILDEGPDAQSGSGLLQFDLLNDVTAIQPSEVYRFLKLPNGDTHFYTSSVSEKNKVDTTLTSEYSFEYINYKVFNNEAPLTVPVYRFYNYTKGTHFYTIKQDERDKVINQFSDVFRYEGIKFYVYKYPTASSVPVYRFLNLNYGDVHFYTARQSEFEKVQNTLSDIFSYEGVAFYVEPV